MIRKLEKSLRPDHPSKWVSFDELDQLQFPAYVTATLEYYATGEGVTRGICMMYVMSELELRNALIKLWDEYFAQGCETTNGLVEWPGFEEMIPEYAKKILEGRNRQERMPHLFSFNTTVHENYA